MKYAALLACCLALCLPPAVNAAETETRGTLRRFSDGNKLHLEVNGNESTFEFNPRRPFYSGTRGDRPKDYSRVPPGAHLIVRHDGARAHTVIEDYGWHQHPGMWLDEQIEDLALWSRDAIGQQSLFSNRGQMLAFLCVILVGIICGLTSSLVVTNRMAFFSDALAHCAFAGVALGWILRFAGAATGDTGILLTMIVFGVAVGVAIAYVREQTSLANDTVIGVFFAGAMGLGAVLLRWIGSTGSGFSPESFVFGDPHGTVGQDLLNLVLLIVLIVLVLGWMYNRLVFASFNPSLARSRGFPVRFANYLFIILLGLVVNICLKTVGALLISALLVLPAASASNVSRNLRQFFWFSIVLSTVAGVAGWLLSWYWIPVIGGRRIQLGSAGTIVVLGVIIFFATMLLARWAKGRRAMARTGF